MAIIERISEKGEKSYQVKIRKKGSEVTKTFSIKEDAELFEYYRTRLIENMANFNIPISERVRLRDIIELKIEGITDARTLSEFELGYKRIYENMKPHKFVCELTEQDWYDCFIKVQATQIQKRNNSKEFGILSPRSVRRIFATISSAISHAIEKGIHVVNHPLQIIQKYINPSLKGNK